MKLKFSVLDILRNSNDYVSGQQLAEKFGVSRTYIWKAISELKQEGYEISCINNRGYKITNEERVFSSEELTKSLGIKVLELISVPSTNDYALNLPEDVLPMLVIAKHQSDGKARHGKKFQSLKEEGIYMSLALKAKVPNEKLQTIARKAIEETRVLLGGEIIENTLYTDGKKRAGVLVEAVCDMDTSSRIVVGTGIYTEGLDINRRVAILRITYAILSEIKALSVE